MTIARLIPAMAAFLVSSVVLAGARPWSADEVSAQARRKSKVLVEGRISRAIDFDTFVLTDPSGDMLLDAKGVRHDLGTGDAVLVWGRYLGRSDRRPAMAEIQAIDIVASGTPEAAALLAARAAEPPAPPAAAPAAGSSIETRLKALDDLKAREIVTDDEYRQQRQRILDEL